MFDFDFLKFKNMVGGVREQATGIRSEIETFKRERDNLLVAPGTKADVIDLFCNHIDQEAAQYPARLRESIKVRLNYGRDVHAGPMGRPQLGILSLARENHHAPFTALELEGSMAFIFGKAMKAAVADAVNSMPWPEDPKPLAGCEAAVDSLDKKISKLEAQERELREAAAAAGVII